MAGFLRTHKIFIGLSAVLAIVIPALTGTSETVQYRYDKMGRLTRAEHRGKTAFDYHYDLMGNRLTHRLQTGMSNALFASYPFSDGSGTTATDASGYGRDGMIHGASWTTEGAVSTALSFDGTDDYVDLPHPGTLPEGSISVWLKLSSTPQNWYAWSFTKNPIEQRYDGAVLGVRGVVSPHFSFSIYNSGWQRAISTTTPQANTWYHLVATWGSEGMRLYVNGVLEGSHTYSSGMPAYTQYSYLGADSWSTYFPGVLDEAKLYNRALTVDEVDTLYRESGLVVLYPFSEGTGSIATDASGHGYDGTIHGASWTVDGNSGTGLHFDGTNDYVDLPHPGHLAEGTMSVWLKLDATPNFWFAWTITMNAIGQHADGVNFGVHGNTSPNIAFGIYDQGWQWVDSGITPQPGVWYHLVSTWGSGGLKIYVNGVQEGTHAYIGGIPTYTHYSYLGADSWGTFLPGTLDEAALYNRALTAEEVGSLYRTSDLVASYPLSEGMGSTATDASGHGYDGTIHGASWTTAGKIGNALSFDGADDHVELPHPGYLTEGTVMGWLKLSSLPTHWYLCTITQNEIGQQLDGMNFGVHGGYSPNMAFGIFDQGWQWADSGITPQTNTWYHLAATWGSEGMRVYVNGVLSGSHTYTGGVPEWTKYAYLGADTWGTFFPGTLDEVKIYSQALTAQEIQVLATEASQAAASAAASLQTSDARTRFAQLRAGGDLVTVEGATLTINLADSPDLNYGVGDFTILVKARTESIGGYDMPVSHVAVSVRDGETLTLYLNGLLQGEQTIGEQAVNRLTVDIGLNEPGARAVVEDVQLFDRALTPEEIVGR